jgi:hypothetical protein
MKYLIVFSILFFTLHSSISLAQEIPTGEWRTHFSYYPVNKLALGKKSIFCASQNALFSYQFDDNSITNYSKLDELSDTSIGAINYHLSSETLIVGYENGNIDLIKQDEIINIRTILNAEIDRKNIHHIFTSGNYAYLSGEFGLSVLDLNKKQLFETYTNIGTNGSTIKVYSSTIANDSIYIASSLGLLVASNRNNVNRLDFANWKVLFSTTDNRLQHIAALNGKVFFTIENNALYRYNQGVIQQLNLANNQSYTGLYTQNENELYFFTENAFYTIEEDGTINRVLESVVKSPRQAAITNEQIWIADEKRGLIHQQGTANPEFIFPNGVYSPIITKVFFSKNNDNGQIIALSNNNSINVFEKGNWKNYVGEENFFNAQIIPSISAINSFTISNNATKVYFGSLSGGVLEWNNSNNTFQIINQGFIVDSQNEIIIRDVLIDTDNKTWALQMGESGGIFQLFNNNWQKISFDNIVSQYLTHIIEDEIGQKWCIVDARAGGGIFVFGNSNQTKLLTDDEGKGKLPSKSVNALIMDREGSIWVGTNKGITEFFNPSDILTSRASDAVEPRFENRKLLQDEVVTSIAVDGGNRKWIGTNNGIWLFSDDGSQLIHHFTSKNSLLPSNTVLHIAIQENTGEVFIATDEGMVSYKGDATSAEATHQNVKVFPNPVNASFTGYITIEGLAEDALVKITDLNGRLVWTTQANGGTAIWNGRDNEGRKAKGGVYLIFSSTEDGQDAYVTKIAVLE